MYGHFIRNKLDFLCKKVIQFRSLSRLIGLKNTKNMERIFEEISKHQKERSTTDVIIGDGRFVKKLERDYGLENFEQNYKAYEEKEIEKYKNAISAGFKKVMEEEQCSLEYAIIKMADIEDEHVRRTPGLQKSNHQFYDQLTFVWMAAQSVLSEITKKVLEEEVA